MPNNNQIAENDLKDAWKDPDALKKAPKVRYDSIREAMGDSDSFWDGVGSAITDTALGRNTFGRIGGLVLDIGLGLFPYGTKINQAREKGKRLLGLDRRKFKFQPKTNSDMNWLINRLQERSTWRGLITALTGLGVLTLGPELRTAIVTAGVAVFALVEVIFKEPQSKDAK